MSGADGLVRLRLDVAYDGTEFSGWASQRGRRTVQATLESALRTVYRLDVEPALTVAGRTDAGVHARGQVCHVDLPADVVVAVERVAERLDGVLPADVRVRRVSVAPAGFDARFSAIWRRYAYRIRDTAATADPLRRKEVLDLARPLDLSRMNAASALLVGEHDFAAYCRKRPGATTIRRLLALGWERDETGIVVGTVIADAFCHSMVRALVGALVAVGEGRRAIEWPARVLARGERDSAVNVVRPHGLTLEEVGYPADEELAVRAREARRFRTLGSPGPAVGTSDAGGDDGTGGAGGDAGTGGAGGDAEGRGAR